jgi:alpha-L-arabinofuranosidase
MSEGRLKIWTDRPQATISPNLYGHFAEHLGRCIYEGVWVGADSSIPNEKGLRLDVLAALKQLRAPVVRWPGGCFADDYHWRNGIGPVAERPLSVNIWWQQAEPNTFGTDEFMRFCRAVGAEPYLSVNVGSGAPAEARDWLEYCNYGGDSTLSQMRAANGRGAPYGVKFWGVGNENWGCGGRFTARDYALEYVRFASYMRAFDRSIKLVACGFGSCTPHETLQHWNRDFCDAMSHADLIDHLSIHRYFKRGAGTGFSDSEYLALFGDLHAMERDIQAADQVLSYYYPDKFVGLVVDEWGVWHPEAVTENGLEQGHTLRDAVFAGACLNLFNRYARRITMANIAQTINVLQCMAMTRGDKMYLTPTYHVFDMMRPHMGATLVSHELEAPEFETHPAGMHSKMLTAALDVSASTNSGKVFVTVANQTVNQDVETRIDVRDATVHAVTGRILNSTNPRDVNDFEHPKTVVPKRLKAELVNNELTVVFPAHSFAALSLSLG